MTDLHATGLQALLEQMEACGASDLHLKSGCPPGLRVDGKLAPIDGVGALGSQLLETLVEAMTSEEQRKELLRAGHLEFAFTVDGLARYRVSLARHRGQTGAVLRRIPAEVPKFDALGLPAAAKRLCQQKRGLVLVGGASGSGRSTTVAAMVDLVNRTGAGHIVTLEDPIEFVHKDQSCFVTQREIGVDCDSFELALRQALRHDADVIVVDGLRDRETILLALAAAETGRLVLGTLHSSDAAHAVDRLLDPFPLAEHAELRGRIAAALQGIVAQTLVPKSGGGRVAAVELLIVTDGVRGCIREGKPNQIHVQIQSGGQLGMQTQAAALAELVFNSTITDVTAIQYAANPEELKNQLSHGAASPLRATQRPAAPAAPAPRTRQPTPALPPWAVAPTPAGTQGATSGALPKRPPLGSPVDPMPARPTAPGATPPKPYVPRNPAPSEPLDKLRRS